MFKLFRKKTQTETVSEKEFVIVKSFYALSQHIAPNDNDAKPLCGYDDGIVTDFTRDKEEIIQSVPNQHQGLMWCSECAHEATGLSMEEISAWRKEA